MPVRSNQLLQAVQYAQQMGLPLDTTRWTQTMLDNFEKWNKAPIVEMVPQSPFGEAVGADFVDTISENPFADPSEFSVATTVPPFNPSTGADFVQTVSENPLCQSVRKYSINFLNCTSRSFRRESRD